ncbi:MAG: alpha-ketoglutarate-dependent dioxygenase AlkB [Lysobacter sp.]|nr:alpha-ketoglutarate-dependent dioxygenase AlkB [Lysobacter sp.]
MSWSSIELPGAEVSIAPDWLQPEQADALFADLRQSVPWGMHRIKLFGREVDSPRLSCWIGDADAGYTYSGTRFEPHAWPEALVPIRDRLINEIGIDFNSVLANLYRDGADCMGWHSDNEAALGSQPVIASLSLGAVRRFVFKRRSEDQTPNPHPPFGHPLPLRRRGETAQLHPGAPSSRRRETAQSCGQASAPLLRSGRGVGVRVCDRTNASDSKRTLELPHGSLLVMRGGTQRNYRHALPRTTKPTGARINLTFRRVRG